MAKDIMNFNLPKEQSSIIKVIGVGGGGSNAVNHMFEAGIRGVDFVVCNTDQQSLDRSTIQKKIVLGAGLTEGRGAGAKAEVGRNAAIESLDEIKEVLENNTKMVFITAGMGGGTGTGAAPVIAEAAKELGILTVAIVTIPFGFEGKKRKLQAMNGLEELKKHVDTVLVVSNDKLREMYGNLKLGEAFAQADSVLTIGAKGIAEIITVSGYINVDFEDVRTVMTNSGVAIMGSASASGSDRALKAVQQALASPLLNDNNIYGSNNILLYISSGDEEVSMDEVTEITDYIQEEAGMDADVIWGNGHDDNLGDQISITIVATGFDSKDLDGLSQNAKPQRKVYELDDKPKATESPKAEVKPTYKKPQLINPNLENLTATVRPEVAETPTNNTERTVHNLEDHIDTSNDLSHSETPIEATNIDQPIAETPSTEAELNITPLSETPAEEARLDNPWNEANHDEMELPETKTEEEILGNISFGRLEEESLLDQQLPIEDEDDEQPTIDVNIITTENEVTKEPTFEQPTAELDQPTANTEECSMEIEERTSELSDINSELEEPTLRIQEPTTEKTEEAEPISAKADQEPTMINFDLPKKEKPTVIKKMDLFGDDTPTEKAKSELSEEPQLLRKPKEDLVQNDNINKDELQRLQEQRFANLRQTASQFRSPANLGELENVPAYKRRNVQLNDVPHSSENPASKLTLSDNGEKDENGNSGTDLRSNNSFLHDNVD